MFNQKQVEQLSLTEIEAQLELLTQQRQRLLESIGDASPDELPLSKDVSANTDSIDIDLLNTSFIPEQKTIEPKVSAIASIKEGKEEGTKETAQQSLRCKVVIVGGRGQLGKLFVGLFSASGYVVEIIEAEDWPNASSKLENSRLVIVAVPIDITVEVIKRLNQLPQDCILADLTSIKARPLAAMLSVHQGPVVGLHPMFGPDLAHIQGQTVVVCEGRYAEQYQWLIEQLNDWQATTYLVDAQKHDETMAFVQVLRHFSTAVYGVHLSQEDICLTDILAMSSPIYRLELAMVGRLFAQAPELYTEIIFANPDNIAMMRRYVTRFERMLELLSKGDKQGFKTAFLATREWFGDFAEVCLYESGRMLEAANQVKNR
ncbi:bifunctional chorismate mutase/prephenate dehydrogenase [Aliikangiella maris]|uniref:Bifunctional chorismate mutase/prephenate dehydrogenase n=2 Tax=Aliikangiella maris TaxID=3162458 RepID=A0ABV3MIJ0_9GAMM